YTTVQGLAHDNVHAVAVDSAENIWAGTCGGGASRYDGSAWTTFTESSTSGGLGGDDVRAVAADSAGNVWFGTYGGGVSRFDGSVWTSYTSASTSGGLACDDVRAVTVDTLDNVWFGTWGSGVSKFDGTDWTTYTTTQGLANNYIHAVAVDPGGNLWFGTWSGGASKFDGSIWTTYTSASTSGGLAADDVRAIAADHEGNLWFGTYGGGVGEYDGSAWTGYDTTNAADLPHNNVYGIATDWEGNRWFATQGGVGMMGKDYPLEMTGDSLRVDDFGNDDLAANPGERIGIDVDFKNLADSTIAYHVVADTAFDQYVNPYPAAKDFDHWLVPEDGSIGSNHTVTMDLTVMVSGDAPEGHELKIPVLFYEGGGSSTLLLGVDTVRITVAGSDQFGPGISGKAVGFVPVGGQAKFRVHLYDGADITTATAYVCTMPDSQVAATLTLYDDGATSGDSIAGDRLFSADWTVDDTSDFQVDISAQDEHGNNSQSAGEIRFTSIEFEKTAPVLLLNRDGNLSSTRLYKEVLDSLGYEYDVWDGLLRYGDEQGDYWPDSSVLALYEDSFVVYNSCCARSSDSRFFIYMEDLNISIWSSPTPVTFPDSADYAAAVGGYLGASFVKDSVGLNSAIGVSGDTIAGGLFLYLNGGKEMDPTGNGVTSMIYPQGLLLASAPDMDLLSARQESFQKRRPVPGKWWLYGDGAGQKGRKIKKTASAALAGTVSSGSAVIRSQTQDYKTFVMGFHLEDITSFNGRRNLTDRVMSWLCGPSPARAGQVSLVRVSNVSPLSATISWFTDVRGDTRVYYGQGTTDTTQMSTAYVEEPATLHRVRLEALSSNTQYNYYVVSDTVSYGPESFLTPVDSGTPLPCPLVGSAFGQDTVTSYAYALVMVRLVDSPGLADTSYYLSTTTDSAGNWLVPLGNSRSIGTGLPITPGSGDLITVDIFSDTRLVGSFSTTYTGADHQVSDDIPLSSVYREVDMYPGLNLIALAIEPLTALSAYDILEQVEGATEIQLFDPVTQLFEGSGIVDGSYYGNDFPLEKQEGYFLRTTDRSEFFLKGQEYDSVDTLELLQGLNMVSLGIASSGYSSFSLLDEVAEINEVLRWDPQLQLYEGAAKAGGVNFGSDFSLEDTEGCILRATSQVDFIPSAALLLASARDEGRAPDVPASGIGTLALRGYGHSVSNVVGWLSDGPVVVNPGGTSFGIVFSTPSLTDRGDTPAEPVLVIEGFEPENQPLCSLETTVDNGRERLSLLRIRGLDAGREYNYTLPGAGKVETSSGKAETSALEAKVPLCVCGIVTGADGEQAGPGALVLVRVVRGDTHGSLLAVTTGAQGRWLANLGNSLIKGKPYTYRRGDALELLVLAGRDQGWAWYRGIALSGESPQLIDGKAMETLRADDLAPPQALPRSFSLGQNFPNPFNPSTTISYCIPGPEDQVMVKLEVYNLRGQLVRRLENSLRAPGAYQVDWDGRDERRRAVSSGVYFYRIQAGQFSRTRKMVILK
ncbi:MAG: two-component regulator propeller domain-containing protein, partial [Gemmatimonadota bacterium]|nr:two-component regulator propeller domain-containing protein [Gemmatimonadota bacterium]